MKVCRGCGELKELKEYYAHKQMSDGHLNKCKCCVKSRVSTHRSDNIGKVQEYDRNRPNHRERVEDAKQRYKDKRKQGDAEFLEKDRLRCKTDQLKHPLKYLARNKLSHSIRDGNIIKPEECMHCGSSEQLQGHHWSYEEEHWLDVIWLCTSCHGKEHIKINKINRSNT
jgi:hypothetical protein